MSGCGCETDACPFVTIVFHTTSKSTCLPCLWAWPVVAVHNILVSYQLPQAASTIIRFSEAECATFEVDQVPPVVIEIHVSVSVAQVTPEPPTVGGRPTGRSRIGVGD